MYHVSRDVAAVARPVYMQIVSAHCVPLHPPSLPQQRQKDPGQTFIRLGIFIFRPTRRQKGVKAWRRRPGAGSGRRGTVEGERAAFTFFGTFNNGGRGTVSFLRQSIQLPRNRHRRWEDGKRQEGLPPPFPFHPFPSLNFSTSSPGGAGFPLSPSPQRAREIMKGGGKGGKKRKTEKKARGRARRAVGEGE